MQMITLTSDQSTFVARGSPRRVRSLASPLPLSPISLFLSLFAAANSPPCVAARVLPGDEAPFILFSRPRRARLLSQFNANEPVSSNYSN
jgi:hypothetical protein